jgi:eukaryotic-like serine/threonine-protein kinase
MIPRSERELFNRAAELFLEALDRPAGQRDGFLDVACGGDLELRQRVASLLGHHDESPLIREAAADPGRDDTPESIDSFFAQQDRYRLLGKTGEGGMSVVFRAQDTVLDRVVALKFLAGRLVPNPGALRRFENEARAAAALGHPNICPIYDIGETGGRPFIVMGHLEGVTLAERLLSGPLDATEVVEIAMQVCRGLSLAHRKGIVHRDIKPANLMLTSTAGHECLVNILDFGIAQLAKGDGPTPRGMTMGTVSYMAPEQIERADVDARADLWALGVVMYRMIAGELPFQGETTEQVVIAITTAEAKPLSSIRAGFPPALNAITAKAMRKDPESRYQSAEELLADLANLQEALKAGPLVARAAAARGAPLRLALAGVMLLAIAVVFLRIRPDHKAPPPKKPIPFTSYLGEEGDPAISPDGTRIAFGWTGESQSYEPDIYVQAMGSSSPVRLTNTKAGEFNPVWSPDGRQIAFLRYVDYQSSIVIMPASGGRERSIPASGPRRLFSSLDWSPVSNSLVADENGAIVAISLRDGTRRALSFPKAGDVDSFARFDPAGRRLVFERHYAHGSTDLLEIPVAGGTPQLIAKPDTVQTAFCWNRDGTALIWAGHRSADGSPLRELRLRDGKVTPLNIDENDAASPDVRGDLLAYTRRILNTNIWAAPLGDAGDADRPAQPLITSSRRDHSPQFSPDGQSIVFASTRSGDVQLWRCDRHGRNATQVTTLEAGGLGTPRWSPDGQWIAFDASVGNNGPDIYVVRAGGGEVRRITHNPATDILPSWSRDGRALYFCSNRGGEDDIWRIPFDGGEASQVTRHGGWESFAARHRDELYYSSTDSLRTIHRLNLDSGEDIALPQLGDAGARRYWALADQGIYFVNTLQDPHVLDYFDLARHRIRQVRRIGEIIRYGPGGLAVSPDGRTVLWPQLDVADADIMIVQAFDQP